MFLNSDRNCVTPSWEYHQAVDFRLRIRCDVAKADFLESLDRRAVPLLKVSHVLILGWTEALRIRLANSRNDHEAQSNAEGSFHRQNLSISALRLITPFPSM
jgi:hypothetical protein